MALCPSHCINILISFQLLINRVQPLVSGYMPPEYVINGIVSVKSDVFSFGVLVLEIVCGKKNHGCYHPERPLNLIGYVSILSHVCSFTDSLESL